MRLEVCPFCPHERHDDSVCCSSGLGGRRCECCGPTEAERVAHDAPGKILSRLGELIEDSGLGSDPIAVQDFLEFCSRFGKFKLRIERTS